MTVVIVTEQLRKDFSISMADLLKHYARETGTNNMIAPLHANKSGSYTCPECAEPVVYCKGLKVPPYFRHHRKTSSCRFYTSESPVHLDAKLYLKDAIENKITLRFQRHCHKCANVFFLEIPPIGENDEDTEVHLEYAFKHNETRRCADLAITTDKEIDVIIEVCNTNPTRSEARPEPWFEVSAQEVVDKCRAAELSGNATERLEFKCIRSDFPVDEYILCNTCEQSAVLKDDNTGVIYVKQRGAGCGKTFESIQLLKSEEYREKDTFIYLSKMKSATAVIYNELQQQLGAGKLGQATVILDSKNGNQRRLELLVPGRERPITVIIGTVDSFTFAIRSAEIQYGGCNMFTDIVRDIAKGNMADLANRSVRYASQPIRFMDKYLIVVDEAQDLDKEYLSAFHNVIEKTNIDMYVIGDKLQSILSEINLFTYLSDTDNARVRKDESSVNIVKRFHNVQFIDFVNAVVPFHRFQLPPVEGICDKHDGSCGHEHEDSVEPFLIDLEFPDLFETTSALDGTDSEPHSESKRKRDIRVAESKKRMDDVLKKFESIIRTNVMKYGYLPHNFCFIFPIVNEKNVTLPIIESFLQDLWTDLFATPETYTEALINNMRRANANAYWSSKLEHRENDIGFYQYVYLHRAEQNRPIDLTESENATRMMSIHASKGTGCECVFLCGISQRNLAIFSGGIPETLVYESLLHVGITRQKKQLYVGIEYNDAVCNRERDSCSMRSRFLRFARNKVSDQRRNCPVSTVKLETLIQNSGILNDLKTDEELGFSDFVPIIGTESKLSIDWGHHVIRAAVLRTAVNAYLVKHMVQEGSQLFALLKAVSNATVEAYEYKYYKQNMAILQNTIDMNLRKRTENKKKGIPNEPGSDLFLPVPVLKFNQNRSLPMEYTKLQTSIVQTCKNVKTKLKESTPDLWFCPMESLIFTFLMEMCQHPFRSSVRMMDIYRIFAYFVDIYNDPSFDRNEHREQYRCTCDQHFCRMTTSSKFLNKDIKNSVWKHHSAIRRISKIMSEYLRTVRGSFGDSRRVYHKEHAVYKIDNRNVGIQSTADFSLVSNDSDPPVSFVAFLRPQLNEMNIAETVVSALLTQLILTENQKGDGGRIVIAIITLDCDSPIFVNFQRLFGSPHLIEKVKSLLATHLIAHYRKNNNVIATFSAEKRSNDDKYEKGQSWYKFVESGLTEFLNFPSAANSKKHIPDYVESTLKQCDREWRRMRKMETSALIAEINHKLDEELNYFVKRSLFDCSDDDL